MIRRSPSVCSCARRRGSAVLVVLTLLAVMAALLIANTQILHALKQELKMVDERQQKKFVPPANAPPTQPADHKTPSP